MPTVLIDDEARNLISEKQREIKKKHDIDMQVNTLASMSIKAGIGRIDVYIKINNDDDKEVNDNN